METLWTIHLLGELSIQREGGEIKKLRRNKPNLLLARLAFDLGKSVSRLDLEDMLWPNSNGKKGPHSLAVALDSLRHTIEPADVEPHSVLQGDTASVYLNPANTKQGDPAGAKRRLLEALKIRFELGDHSGIALTVEALAEIAHISGDAECAVQLMAGAAAIREKYGTQVAPGSRAAYDKAIGRYRSAMPDIDFEAAWSVGSALTLKTLVLFATEHRQIP